MARSLGLVTRGSLKDGLTLKLDEGVSVEAGPAPAGADFDAL